MKNVKKLLYGLINTKPVKTTFSLLPISFLPNSVDSWEKEYSGGRWAYLNNLSQLSRYSIIAGYYKHFSPTESVLDIACGEGILNEKIHSSLNLEYIGIDISKNAIKAANRNKNEKSTFIQTDAFSYCTDKKFGTIIFNECLYYFKIPKSLVAYYEKYLARGGIFIVSMFSSVGTKLIWDKLGKTYKTIDEISLSHKKGGAWKVKVLKKK